MDYVKLGNTDLSVSKIGFGGAEIGNLKAKQDTVDVLLNSAIDIGLNLIDTAAAYWKSEEMIGNAIGARRKEVVLMSKCGAIEGFTQQDWSKAGILDTIQNSLSLLQTDHLDVAQLHSCDRKTLERGDCIEGLIRAKEKGYARYVGYSGDSQDARFALEIGFFDTLQTSISIADQESIDLTLPIAKEHNIGVIAKRPIANAVWRHDSKPEDPYHHEYWDRIEKLQYSFLNDELNESVAKALRFTLSIEGVHTAIVGTANPDRWEQNAKMLEQVEFSERDFQSVRDRWKEISEDDWVGQV